MRFSPPLYFSNLVLIRKSPFPDENTPESDTPKPETLPFGPLGFAELLKRPPCGGRSAELLLRSMKSTDPFGFAELLLRSMKSTD